MTLERGTLLHKRYRIVEILGQGGMGSVYRAVDENLGVDVAVKENLFTTDEYARQFRLEAVILASLRHPNLPRVSDHFAIGDQGQYLIMDFIEGEDLRQRMERMGTITEDDAVMVGAAMCDALTYLHTRRPSILHRDIKPGNVKITPDGNIYLVDFGLAKLVQGSQATTTGARAMTPGYSPPEQYGTARTDPRTDIYSLGATLYAALTGMIPEDGLARAMDNAQLTPLRKRNPKISKKLSVAIEKAMAVDPADRYQNAEDFKKALLAAKSRTERPTGEFTVVPPPGSVNSNGVLGAPKRDSEPKAGELPLPAFSEDKNKPFVPPSKRRRRSPIGLTLLFIALIAAAGAFILLPNDLYPSIRASLPIPEFFPVVALVSTSTPTSPAADIPTLAASTATAQPTATSTQLPSPTPPEPTPTMVESLIGGGPGQIAFASDRSGIPQIWLSSLDGSDVKVLTNMTDGACEPAWSPDGLRLAFVSPCKKRLDLSEPLPNDTAIYIIQVNPDGTASEETPEPTALPRGQGGDSEPAWSPDGKRIAFTSTRDGRALIYVMTLADESVVRLTEPSNDFQIARQPAWSPFGNQIVYAKKRGGYYQIWAMTDTGKGDQQIARSGQEYWDYSPVWSPDGKSIVFSQRLYEKTVQPGAMQIPYENRDTALVTALTQLNPRPVENARYSPDGMWFVFEHVKEGEGNNWDIWFGAISGEHLLQRLTTDPGVDFDPAWRPSARTP